jgi:hypothetical protein
MKHNLLTPLIFTLLNIMSTSEVTPEVVVSVSDYGACDTSEVLEEKPCCSRRRCARIFGALLISLIVYGFILLIGISSRKNCLEKQKETGTDENCREHPILFATCFFLPLLLICFCALFQVWRR